MNLWTMIVIIVAIGVVKDIIIARNKQNSNEPENGDNKSSGTITRLKHRIENLETLVLEKDRRRRFAGSRKC